MRTCGCGHSYDAHEHYRPGMECAFCDCSRFRAGLLDAATWRLRIDRTGIWPFRWRWDISCSVPGGLGGFHDFRYGDSLTQWNARRRLDRARREFERELAAITEDEAYS
jgi:hypothetical protein